MDVVVITVMALASSLVLAGIGLVALGAARQRASLRRERSRSSDVAALVRGAVNAGMHVTARALERTPTVRDSIQSIVSWVDTVRPSARSAIGSDGTVTILFSDIENSTAINAQLGDELWVDAIRAHAKQVRGIVDAHGGRVVKSQGDGFMVAFAEPGAAVLCAVDLQRAVAGEGTFSVRVGIHSGTVIAEDDDFFGVTVIRAARIAQHAEGGEILVSHEAAEQAGDAAVTFDDRGEVELRGIEGTQRIRSVRWRAGSMRAGPAPPA